MNPAERAQFVTAMSEAANFIRQAEKALRRARNACHGELFDHVDLVSTRAYELQVRAEWMREVALGNVPLRADESEARNREVPDRRRGVDRRVTSMRKLVRKLDAA